MIKEILIAIIFVPITFIVGSFYENWIWQIMSPELQIGTYLGGRGLIVFIIQSCVTVLVGLILYHSFKNRLRSKFRSDLVIFILFWVIALAILMNPVIVSVWLGKGV